MFAPIATAKSEKRFTSIDALARQIRATAPQLDWPQDRSLAVKIGAIDRGETQWWLSRPEQTQTLAELLGLPLADLGLAPAPKKAGFVFSEFPELPALILGEELACHLNEVVNKRDEDRTDELSEWLEGYRQGPVRNPMTGISWLEVTPGAGLSLLMAKFSALCRFDFVQVGHLHQLAERLQKPSPLVVSISQEPSYQDLIALATARRDKAILVIAPFAFEFESNEPETELYSSWEFQKTEGAQRAVMLLSDTRSLSGMKQLQMRLLRTWQTRLLNWVEERLKAYGVDTHFSAEGFMRWLETFKGLHVAVDTPGELLGICRFCHRLPETQLPRASNIQAGSALLQCLLGANSSQAALAQILIARHYRESETVWGQSMALSQWGRLCAEYPGDASQEELLLIARLPRLAEREQAARDLRATQDGRRVSSLIDCDLLTEQPDGTFQLRPRFVIDLIARDHMLQALVAGPVEAWAAIGYDARRRSVLETALACLELERLMPLAAFLALASTEDPYAVSVSELLFYELAQRMREGVVLESVFAHVSRHVASQFSFQPQTRWVNGLADTLDWLSACWEWSLAMPKPDSIWFLPWLFPGWAEDLGSDPIYLPEKPDTGKYGNRNIDPAWLKMFEVAGRWARTLESPPAAAPAFTWPHLLVGVARGRWPAQPDWWRQVLKHDWAAQILMFEFPAHSVSGAGGLLASLMDFIAAEKDLDMMWFSLWPILHRLLSRLSGSEFESVLQGHGRRFFLTHPETLPPQLRKLLLTPSIIRDSDREKQTGKLLSLVESIDILIELAAEIPQAATRLWAFAPLEAERILLTPGESTASSPLCEELVRQCPPIGVSAAIVHMRKNPDADWYFLKTWGLSQLKNPGAPTAELLALLRALEDQV